MTPLFVAAVESIYATALEPAHWPAALQATANVFGDVGANLLWRRDDGAFGVIVSPGINVSQVEEYKSEWWKKDIRAARAADALGMSDGNALTDRHVASREEIQTHPIYTEFLARYGMRWVAGTYISPDPNIFVSLNVQRATTKSEFTDGELATLARLGRHAEKALRLSIRLLDSELGTLGLRDALSRLGVAVFALDSLERVVFTNPAAESLIGDALYAERERLRISSLTARNEIGLAIGRVLQASAERAMEDPKPILIQRPGSRPLTVYVLPVRAPLSVAEEFLTHVRAIVLAIDPKSDDPPDPALVRDLLGLTLGEARVASLVGSGLPPREAADKLGISEETARTALKRVFSKTGVSRQSELSALLTKLVLR
jgi:DNA-binding CsgD family transcriptional regulator/PAS domain-containing protein